MASFYNRRQKDYERLARDIHSLIVKIVKKASEIRTKTEEAIKKRRAGTKEGLVKPAQELVYGKMEESHAIKLDRKALKHILRGRSEEEAEDVYRTWAFLEATRWSMPEGDQQGVTWAELTVRYLQAGGDQRKEIDEDETKRIRLQRKFTKEVEELKKRVLSIIGKAADEHEAHLFKPAMQKAKRLKTIGVHGHYAAVKGMPWCHGSQVSEPEVSQEILSRQPMASTKRAKHFGQKASGGLTLRG